MGQKRRPQPKKLKKKLREIRLRLKFTQDQLARELVKLGAEKVVHSGYVSDFETGKREPSLLALLAYARLAEVSTDLLIDDKEELP